MNKIKVIVKRPDEEFGHVCAISNTLRNLQSTVGGNIETVTLPGGLVIICNEEGWLRGFSYNFVFCRPLYGFEPLQTKENIYGTVIVCGVDGDDFGDVPISFAEWKEILKEWGN